MRARIGVSKFSPTPTLTNLPTPTDSRLRFRSPGFHENDYQVRDFFDTGYNMAISAQNPLLKVNYFL